MPKSGKKLAAVTEQPTQQPGWYVEAMLARFTDEQGQVTAVFGPDYILCQVYRAAYEKGWHEGQALGRDSSHERSLEERDMSAYEFDSKYPPQR